MPDLFFDLSDKHWRGDPASTLDEVAATGRPYVDFYGNNRAPLVDPGERLYLTCHGQVVGYGVLRDLVHRGRSSFRAYLEPEPATGRVLYHTYVRARPYTGDYYQGWCYRTWGRGQERRRGPTQRVRGG